MTIGRIRREHFIKGKTIKEIARDLKVSRNTVHKGAAVGCDIVSLRSWLIAFGERHHTCFAGVGSEPWSVILRTYGAMPSKRSHELRHDTSAFT